MAVGRRAWLLVLFACVLALAGCAPISRAEQGALEQVIGLSAGEQVGQTLKASYAGLRGVAFYLNPQTDLPPTGVLHLYLKSSPDAESVLAIMADLPVAQINAPGYYSFGFEIQPDSTQADYYVELELEGSGRMDLGSAPGAAYLYGAAYANGEPLDAQLAFQLAYDPLYLAGGLLLEGLNWLALLLGAAFLLVLPGWALLSGTLPDWPYLRWPEKTALAAGVGLALYPVLFLWAHLLNVAPGAVWSWAPGLFGAVFLFWRAQRAPETRFFWRRLKLRSADKAELWPDLVFGLALLVIFATRFWAIRSIDVPLWGDAYQHTMIAQRMLDAGGLFDSWLPYVPYSSLTVQYGFPALAALWAWLSGQDILQSVLVAGQLTNGLAVLAIYPLALWLSRGKRWVASFSVLVAGLLTLIPAIYVNWGRYAQLSGQAVLPVALALLLYLALRKGRAGFGEIALNALVIAGLLLHYYRMAFYYVTFLPVVIILAVPLLRQRAFAWPARLLTLAATAGLAVALLAPWVPNVLGSNLTGMVESGVSGNNPANVILGDFTVWKQIQTYISPGLLAASGLALLAALALRRWAVAGLALWMGLLAAFRLGMFVGLPGANMMQSFAVIIFLYAPIGLVLGWLSGEAAGAVLVRWPRAGLASVLLATGLALAFGARLQKGVADPHTYAIAVRPDLRAMQWVRAHTPEDAVFLVEGFTIYGGATAVGSDGGWWLSLLGGRQNTMPPQYAMMNERPLAPGYTQAVVDLVKALEQRPWSEYLLAEQLCAWKVTHVYIGQRAGLASTEQRQLFNPQDFATWPLVYAEDRVRIFAVPTELCQ